MNSKCETNKKIKAIMEAEDKKPSRIADKAGIRRDLRTVCSKVSKERAEEICSMVRSRRHPKIDPGTPVPLDEGAFYSEKALQRGETGE